MFCCLIFIINNCFRITEFVKRRINKLRQLNLSDSVEKCAVLLYIDSLFNFLNCPVKNIGRNYVACAYSTEVSHHILDNFCVMAGNKR